MTEAEWLACRDPRVMLRFLEVEGKTTRRKVLLFAASCWWCWRQMLADDRSRNGVRALEALAEGEQFDEQNVHFATNGEMKFAIICGGKYNAGLMIQPDYHFDAAFYSVEMVADAEAAEMEEPDAGKYLCRYTLFVRDIVGNPFRSVTFSPAWRTDTAISLASQIYGSRDFSAMPILADALQDAGCDSTEVLDHCRGPGPHVRGCWVVDLVLGKQ